MNRDDFRADDWTKIWAGNWKLLSCAHFGVQYTKEIRFGDRPFVKDGLANQTATRSAQCFL
jgi:hypothetical protein